MKFSTLCFIALPMLNNSTAGLKKNVDSQDEKVKKAKRQEGKMPGSICTTILFCFEKNLCKFCILLLTLYILCTHISFKKILGTPTYIECFIIKVYDFNTTCMVIKLQANFLLIKNLVHFTCCSKCQSCYTDQT